MKTISTSELRSKTRVPVRTLENGKAVGLTHRGHRLGNDVGPWGKAANSTS